MNTIPLSIQSDIQENYLHDDFLGQVSGYKE